MSLPTGPVSRLGSYSRFPERISLSSSSTARRAWSLLPLRPVCRSTPVWTEVMTVLKATITIDMTLIARSVSTSVVPCSERHRSLASTSASRRGGLVGGLGDDRSKVDLDREVGHDVGASGH